LSTQKEKDRAVTAARPEVREESPPGVGKRDKPSQRKKLLYEALNKASHKMGLAFSFAHFSALLLHI
jgi:hypothetical protein